MNSVRGLKMLWSAVAVLVVFALSGIVGFGQEGDGEAVNFMDAPESPIEVEGAWSAVIGDFNEDGHADIAVLCPFFYSPEHTYMEEGGTAAVGILLGNGDGTFKSLPYFPVGDSSYDPVWIAAGDFSNDGHLDLAVTNPRGFSFVSFPSDVYLLLGDGNGGFSSAPGSPVKTGNGASGMAAADFDKDGNLDLAVACEMKDYISIFYGDGAEGFSYEQRIRLTFNTGPLAIVAADFNEDSYLDLATSNIGVNGDSVFVVVTDVEILGQGTGGPFLKVHEYEVGEWPESLALGDFNEDGHLDIAVANSSALEVEEWVFKYIVSLLLGDGTGEFADPIHVEIDGDKPDWIITEDFDNDGYLDLLTANMVSNDVSFLRGDGHGGFQLAPSSPLQMIFGEFGVRWVGAEDFNEDGWSDFAVLGAGSDTITMKLNKLGLED